MGFYEFTFFFVTGRIYFKTRFFLNPLKSRVRPLRSGFWPLRSRPEYTKIARFSAAAAAIFTAPQKFARFFEAPRCAISFAKKIASEPRFLLRIEWVKVVLAAEFPAIPSSAVKIASERRCAILVHSGNKTLSAIPFRSPSKGITYRGA